MYMPVSLEQMHAIDRLNQVAQSMVDDAVKDLLSKGDKDQAILTFRAKSTFRQAPATREYLEAVLAAALSRLATQGRS